MIEPPQIIQTTPRATAMIPIIVSWEEIGAVMGPTIRELLDELATQGVVPAGPWFTHHLRRPTETFDLEVSIPVVKPVKPAGRVQPSFWPAMTAARTVYSGPYEGLGEAWGEFLRWIETGSHATAEDLWECYLSGPETDPDPATFRTELIRPLLPGTSHA